MKLEAYDIESLRKIVRALQLENFELKEKLKKVNIPFLNNNVFTEKIENIDEYDFDQGGRINFPNNISDEMAQKFFAMFWGRTDVFAKRGKEGGYFPQCDNRWNKILCPKQKGEKCFCDKCENKKWTKLELWRIKEHLKGEKEDCTDVIGIYPLLSDGTCRFIVFDFDNHDKGCNENDYVNSDDEWHFEVDALRKICEINGINHLVERSKSGKGAHLWIFFKKPILASLARNFGILLLEKGALSINMKSFKYYDRMYPSQDNSDSIGNLIALPLQGQALKNGNSAFVDEHWNAYSNQWDILLNCTKKLELEEIKLFINKWKEELAIQDGVSLNFAIENKLKPWNNKKTFLKSDVEGKMHIVLSDGVYIDTLNLMPRIQNQIRSLAAFDNPEYYKNKRLGVSNYYNYSMIYLGKDIDGYINIPRGLKEIIIEKCNEAGIEVEILDQRQKGRPIRVDFKGNLRIQQELAAQKLLSFSDGILSAATAFGKTVVCSYLISQRKVNTLVLLQSKDLLLQWVEELNKFLNIDEEMPEYQTKKGKTKKRSSAIGILQGSKNTLTGIVDVAMVQSICNKDNFEDLVKQYGMVIMDECHHSASKSSLKVLQNISSKYVYGVSATPKRGDKLDKIIYMMLGPLRHQFTALDRAKEQDIERFIIPRYTKVVDNFDSKENINKAYDLITLNEVRNNMIVDDVKECINNGRTPVILTRTKEHAKNLATKLSTAAEFVYTLYGDNTDKENANIRLKLKEIPKDKSIILIATGQKIGEGFDFPRLDTLMLVSPISFDGRLEQYIGRLNRDYEGKTTIFVYDYVDSHMKYFDIMFNKRLRTYKKLGYSILNAGINNKQVVNAIYNSSNYIEKFEQDIIEANKAIVISSPNLSFDKIERFIYISNLVLERGVQITIITESPENVMFDNASFIEELIHKIKSNGINVITKQEIVSRFAVIDDTIVWHGGMNLLGKDDIWDNLIRIKDSYIAAELLEIELSK